MKRQGSSSTKKKKIIAKKKKTTVKKKRKSKSSKPLNLVNELEVQEMQIGKLSNSYESIADLSKSDGLIEIFSEGESTRNTFDSDKLKYVDLGDDKEIIEKVQIFGVDDSKVLPIITDPEGRLKVVADITINPISYREIVIKNLPSLNNYNFTQPFDVSQSTRTSFIVVNRSLVNTVTVQLQNSPDNSIYETDLPEDTIKPNSFKILTPTRFIRFYRIAYRSTIADKPAVIDVYYQSQGNPVMP
ncbi:hypothetical protein BHF71_02855 [Vulcanibacillus modesticaldus]|uniref:DUF6385 domain-containing protein n=1 Tax=Vulcanibacillus modesticaldus TaxID=337097 RepID=A0A1D2YT72_9BACI|nr:DUF6385 domain-containing protein [Vulcanibacillus modesticaldus]OEF98883.1 hypothetical protein BHF71_02855 [Vulcanibacillus modesticaldus]